MTFDRRWLLPAFAMLLLLAAACGDDDNDTDASPTSAPTTAATSTATAEPTESPTAEATEAPTEAATEAPTEAATEAPSGTTHAATIENFQLPDLTIAVGDTIRWTNADSAPHTSTGRNREWDSGTLSQGSAFSETFSTAGSFEYYCEIHPSMVGTITVQ
jgi:plastocyanin